MPVLSGVLKGSVLGPIILLISAIFLIHLNDNTDTVSTANVFLFLVTKVVTQGRDIEWLEVKMLKKVDAMSQYFVKINLVVNAETTGCVCFWTHQKKNLNDNKIPDFFTDIS